MPRTEMRLITCDCVVATAVRNVSWGDCVSLVCLLTDAFSDSPTQMMDAFTVVSLLGLALLTGTTRVIVSADGLSAESALALTVSTTNAPAAVDACASWLSDGDQAVGILVTRDITCVQGGIGCIGLLCRYCRVRDTPQSSHFLACGSSSWSPPEVFPPSVNTSSDSCAEWSSPADRAVGVMTFNDSTCDSGGSGCIRGTTCRFCRVNDSDQSQHFPVCPSTAVPTPPATSDEACSSLSTSGDRSVGIHVANDASCVSGGTGCINTTCRFCRSFETTRSRHLLPCDGLTQKNAAVRVESLRASSNSTDDIEGYTSALVFAAAVAAVVAVVIAVMAVTMVKRMIVRMYREARRKPMSMEQGAVPFSII